MQANTSYNAVISGNIQANGGSSAPVAAAYPITGDGISGYLYIENGTRVYGTLHVEIQEGTIVYGSSVGLLDSMGSVGSTSQQAMVSATYFQEEGSSYETLSHSKPIYIPYNGSLAPVYPYELNGFHVMIPTFTYNGETYTGAGALSAYINLGMSMFENRTLQYYLNFSTDYMREQIGDLYVYDSTEWKYKSLIGASFDFQFTYLLGSAYDYYDSSTETPNS
jgi:hypothetical protein